MSNKNEITGLGLGEIRRNKTIIPQKIEPDNAVKQHRSLPTDQILIHPSRRLTKSDTPKSVQMQLDTHMAIKMISTIENKRMYEVLTEITEAYVKNMPESSKKLIIDNIRAVQRHMPNI